MSESTAPLMLPRAILFDMDGTLTAPMLDFPRIRAEMGIAPGQPILEALAVLKDSHRHVANAVLEQHEDHAAQNSTLNPGCRELLEWIGVRHIRVALITRNSLRSTNIVQQRHNLGIKVLITREEGLYKPNPAPLLLACRRLKVPPAQTWMVGDGQYDVEAGCAAGIATVWLSHGRPRTFIAQPWKTVADLHALAELLRSCVTISPSPGTPGEGGVRA